MTRDCPIYAAAPQCTERALLELRRHGYGGDSVLSEPLPQLLDCKALQAELGVTRAAAEALMRHLPVVMIEDLRKTYVRRSDVVAYLETRTFDKHQVPA